MDLDLPELDTTVLGLTIALWAFFAALFWFGPGIIGMKEYSLWMKIGLSAGLLPIAYLICNKIINQ